MDKINELEYLDRHLQKKRQVRFSQKLRTYPHEKEVAKLYQQFIVENPSIDDNDIKVDIDRKYEDEDAYGHCCGYDETLLIYTMRDETNKEYDKRIKEGEDKAVDAVAGVLAYAMNRARHKLGLDDNPEEWAKIEQRIIDEARKKMPFTNNI
jgi:hypothetical protein